MKIPNILLTISDRLKSLNAKAIIVGGSVRDHFLSLEIKDYDIEVYGLSSIDELENLLKEYGNVKLVGKSFGVLKFVHDDKEYDFSFPRLEKKSGVGHKGFRVLSDGFLSFKEASKRRDFTINAMGYDIQKRLFLDPFNAKEDLKARILRHIDDKTFVEDPLRLYRGVQFCARFELMMADQTKELCKKMVEQGELKELPKERIFEEMKKLLLRAKKPSVGLELLKELGVFRYFPEIGDDWQKLDRLASHEDIVIMLAALGLHLKQSELESFLLRFTSEVKLIESVKALVLAYHYILTDKMDDKKIRRLSTKVNLRKLSIIAEDNELFEAAKRLGVEESPPSELIHGRDLISLGLKPSQEFSKILKDIYERQLDGKIRDRDEALRYLKEKLWQ